MEGIAVSIISLMCCISSCILLGINLEQKRHNKSLETLLTEIRDRLKPPG